MKVQLELVCDRGGISRIYVLGEFAELGFFEQTETRMARDGSDYYSRHRIAKGDLYEYETSRITFHGPEGLDAAVLTAIGATPEQSKSRGGIGDQFDIWMCLCEHAKGFSYFVTKRPKSARDKEIAKANAARHNLLIEVDFTESVAS